MEEDIRYVHVDIGGGKLTLAIDMEKYRFGAAWCSPHDQFCRKKGRMIARGRLKTDKTTHVIDFHVRERPWKELIPAVVHMALFSVNHKGEDVVVPGWAKRARAC